MARPQRNLAMLSPITSVCASGCVQCTTQLSSWKIARSLGSCSLVAQRTYNYNRCLSFFSLLFPRPPMVADSCGFDQPHSSNHHRYCPDVAVDSVYIVVSCSLQSASCSFCTIYMYGCSIDSIIRANVASEINSNQALIT